MKLCSLAANEVWLDLKKAGITGGGAYGENRKKSHRALTLCQKCIDKDMWMH